MTEKPDKQIPPACVTCKWFSEGEATGRYTGKHTVKGKCSSPQYRDATDIIYAYYKEKAYCEGRNCYWEPQTPPRECKTCRHSSKHNPTGSLCIDGDCTKTPVKLHWEAVPPPEAKPLSRAELEEIRKKRFEDCECIVCKEKSWGYIDYVSICKKHDYEFRDSPECGEYATQERILEFAVRKWQEKKAGSPKETKAAKQPACVDCAHFREEDKTCYSPMHTRSPLLRHIYEETTYCGGKQFTPRACGNCGHDLPVIDPKNDFNCDAEGDCLHADKWTPREAKPPYVSDGKSCGTCDLGTAAKRCTGPGSRNGPCKSWVSREASPPAKATPGCLRCGFGLGSQYAGYDLEGFLFCEQCAKEWWNSPENKEYYECGSNRVEQKRIRKAWADRTRVKKCIRCGGKPQAVNADFCKKCWNEYAESDYFKKGVAPTKELHRQWADETRWETFPKQDCPQCKHAEANTNGKTNHPYYCPIAYPKGEGGCYFGAGDKLCCDQFEAKPESRPCKRWEHNHAIPFKPGYSTCKECEKAGSDVDCGKRWECSKCPSKITEGKKVTPKMETKKGKVEEKQSCLNCTGLREKLDHEEDGEDVYACDKNKGSSCVPAYPPCSHYARGITCWNCEHFAGKGKRCKDVKHYTARNPKVVCSEHAFREPGTKEDKAKAKDTYVQFTPRKELCPTCVHVAGANGGWWGRGNCSAKHDLDLEENPCDSYKETPAKTVKTERCPSCEFYRRKAGNVDWCREWDKRLYSHLKCNLYIRNDYKAKEQTKMAKSKKKCDTCKYSSQYTSKSCFDLAGNCSNYNKWVEYVETEKKETPKVKQPEKMCGTCKYDGDIMLDEPCDECFDYDKWVVKVTQTRACDCGAELSPADVICESCGKVILLRRTTGVDGKLSVSIDAEQFDKIIELLERQSRGISTFDVPGEKPTIFTVKGLRNAEDRTRIQKMIDDSGIGNCLILPAERIEGIYGEGYHDITAKLPEEAEPWILPRAKIRKYARKFLKKKATVIVAYNPGVVHGYVKDAELFARYGDKQLRVTCKGFTKEECKSVANAIYAEYEAMKAGKPPKIGKKDWNHCKRCSYYEKRACRKGQNPRKQWRGSGCSEFESNEGKPAKLPKTRSPAWHAKQMKKGKCDGICVVGRREEYGDTMYELGGSNQYRVSDATIDWTDCEMLAHAIMDLVSPKQSKQPKQPKEPSLRQLRKDVKAKEHLAARKLRENEKAAEIARLKGRIAEMEAKLE